MKNDAINIHTDETIDKQRLYTKKLMWN